MLFLLFFCFVLALWFSRLFCMVLVVVVVLVALFSRVSSQLHVSFAHTASLIDDRALHQHEVFSCLRALLVLIFPANSWISSLALDVNERVSVFKRQSRVGRSVVAITPPKKRQKQRKQNKIIIILINKVIIIMIIKILVVY